MQSPKNVQSVLKELLHGEHTSHDQMLGILEHYRSVLVRCMKTFTPQTLGKLACLQSDSSDLCHDLERDNPRIISLDKKFSLKTQGIFAGTPFARKTGFNEYVTFGIDCSSGEFLLIRIMYALIDLSYEEAISVNVSIADLGTVIRDTDIPPIMVWEFFRIAFDTWLSDRKRLYEEACAVNRQIDIENEILTHIFPH